MQKFKFPFIQLFLALLFILSIILIIRETTYSMTLPARVATANTAESNKFPVFDEQSQNVLTEFDSAAAAATSCRYGVSSWSSNDYNFLQDLGVGWALNFNVNFGQNLPEGVEYTPMVRFMPEKNGAGQRTGNYIVNGPSFTDGPDGLGPIIEANPGRLWIIGNEVDRIDVQDDLMPDVYAKAYHDAYHFIKERDPSAQIAVSGLVQVTPGRLQYLDMVWNSYLQKYGTPMPVDVWNFHIYILAEKFPDGSNAEAAIALGTDPAIAIWGSGGVASQCSRSDVYCYAEHDDMGIFAQQVVAMRQWMKAHGQQEKPLILSEYSLLFPYEVDSPSSCFVMDEYGNCYTPERVSQFMINSFDYLESATDKNLGYSLDNHRLVQQWLWFTVNAPGAFASDLLNDNYTLRLPGQTFQAEMDALRPFSTNLFIDQVHPAVAQTGTLTDPVTTTVSAVIYNNGDTATTEPITVTVYADQAKTQEIGTGVITEPLMGCARRQATITAQVEWDSLAPGVHPYWVELEGGNTMQGLVFVDPEQVFLPTITR